MPAAVLSLRRVLHRALECILLTDFEHIRPILTQTAQMKATLVIPSASSFTRKYRLSPRAKGKAKRGFQVVHSHFGRVLNGGRFQDLRDVLGATIETDNVVKAAAILGLPPREPGLIPLK